MSAELKNPCYYLVLPAILDQWNRPLRKVFSNRSHAMKYITCNGVTDYLLFEQKTKSHLTSLRYVNATFKLVNWTGTEKTQREIDNAERDACNGYQEFEPIWWKLVTFPFDIATSVEAFEKNGK